MKPSNKPKFGLLILNRDNFYLYTTEIAGFLTMSFPESCIKNLEIVSQDRLQEQIRQFVEGNKISPAELTIILSSDILFEKEIEGGPEESQNRQKFLDSLPFESVYKIVIPKDQKPYIITVNRDFVDGITRSFTQLGFTVERAVPNEFLQKNSIQVVDVNNAQDIIKKAEGMKIYNMLDYQQKTDSGQQPTATNTRNEGSKTRLYVMLGILGIVIIVFVVAFLTKK